MRTLRPRTVATQMLTWQLVILVTMLIAGLVLAGYDARQDAYDGARTRALDIARTLADSPDVRTALRTSDPSAELQPHAERVRRDTRTDFVVVMTPEGRRYTHPDLTQLGRRFRGSIAEAARGREITETYTGTLGPSVRAVVPVRDGGQVVALVSVGIRVAEVNRAILRTLPVLLLIAVTVGALGALGTWLVQRRLRRQTHGLGEVEITRMYEYYDAVLRAVREGLLLLDLDGRVTMANDEAARMLDDGTGLDGRRLDELGLGELDVDGEAQDVSVVLHDRVVVVSRAPAEWSGRRVGWVVTLRDRTELQAVVAELDTVRGMANALRAQNHGAANQLHTMVSLVEMGESDAAIRYATEELAMTQSLTDTVVEAVADPVLEALLLGKIAVAHERGVRLRVSPDSSVAETPVSAHDLVTLVGNLLDNAIDAAQAGDDPQVTVQVRTTDDRTLVVVVDDGGDGIPPARRERVFEAGWSSKPDPEGYGRGVGLALVGQIVRRRHGTATVDTSPLGGARITVTLPGGPA